MRQLCVGWRPRARSSSARRTWTSSRWAHRPRTRPFSPRITHGASIGCRAARAVGRPRPWPPVWRPIDTLGELGAEVGPVSMPHTEYGLAAYYLIAPAEASANLARYDSVKYGYRAPDATTVVDSYLKSRGEGFGPEVKRRIMLGT